jgi:hypothetical protein
MRLRQRIFTDFFGWFLRHHRGWQGWEKGMIVLRGKNFGGWIVSEFLVV